MAAALTPPFTVAALVLCAAGIAKLRSPAGAGQALATLGVPVPSAAVRSFAALELALGTWSAIAPSRAGAAALAVLYGAFAVIALALVRRHAACGCFGARDEPASPLQSLLSAVLGAVATAAAFATPHGLGWLAGVAPIAPVGVLAAACATVLAYTELPLIWSAWSER